MLMPGIGKPQLPGLRAPTMGVKVPVGEVSVMPQPSFKLAPVSALNRAFTSTGSGAPPVPQYLSERRSNFSASGCARMPVNMVGTPGKMVTFFSASSFSTVGTSKRVCRMTSAPMRMPNTMFKLSAKMWKGGSTARMRSWPNSTTLVSPLTVSKNWLHAAIRLAWVSIAPLGKPVVPPVYCNTATASRGSASACGVKAPSLSSSCAKVLCRGSASSVLICPPLTIAPRTTALCAAISARSPTTKCLSRVVSSRRRICG